MATVSVVYNKIRMKIGTEKIRIVTVTCGASDYPNGGYPITPAECGFGHVVTLMPHPSIAGVVWVWDITNQKLKGLKVGSAGVMTEVANTDVANEVVICWAYGS